MPKPLFAGNWKLHKTVSEALELAGAIKSELDGLSEADVLICPPFTALKPVADLLAGSSILLGAQDFFWEDSGAYTGEVSAPLLKDVGCSHVIIGHSERREYFKETDEMINLKLKAALAAGLTPILCVGESLEKREHHVTKEFLSKQLTEDLKGVDREAAEGMVIAYEPIWAIGTGKTATPEIAGETQAFIRTLLADRFDRDLAEGMRIIYGGSAKPDNARALLAHPDVNGFLVGGASLKADSFVEIVRFSLL